MAYNPDIHHRRSIRLKEYDYTQDGLYFITICTFQRTYLFGDISKGKMKLNSYGEIASTIWQNIPLHFPVINILEYMISIGKLMILF